MRGVVDGGGGVRYRVALDFVGGRRGFERREERLLALGGREPYPPA